MLYTYTRGPYIFVRPEWEVFVFQLFSTFFFMFVYFPIEDIFVFF